LKEVGPADSAGRQARYNRINRALPALRNLDRPVIGAINGHAIGMGMVWSSLCDIRVAADDAVFSIPEVAHGMAAPIGGFLMRLNMPAGLIREMLFTGRRFSAKELHAVRYFNYVTPRADVLAKAIEIAEQIAPFRSSAVRATKIVANEAEALSWQDGYEFGQTYSMRLAKRDGTAPD
jgi:enoyl-CoA hydratase/carnithine racemase